jgi:hypothetical protein
MQQLVSADMIANVVAASDQATELNFIHCVGNTDSLAEQMSTISLSNDTRQLKNESCKNVQRSTIVFERRNGSKRRLRLGFTCKYVQEGDLICQFGGFDTSLIARVVDGSEILIGTRMGIKSWKKKFRARRLGKNRDRSDRWRRIELACDTGWEGAGSRGV